MAAKNVENKFWAKLCLHAIVRGMVVGNLQTQASFAFHQSARFSNSTEVNVLKPYIQSANIQATVFICAGLLARLIVIKFPSISRFLAYFGLGIWLIGVGALWAAGWFITWSMFEILSYSLVDIGGGVYFWASLDDIVLLGLESNHLILAVFGCFATAYSFVIFWIYGDFIDLECGFLFIYPLLFILAFPISLVLGIEEWNVGSTYIDKPVDAHISTWEFIKKMFRYSGDISFGLHLVFVVVFSVLVQLPPLNLYLHHNRSIVQSQALTFWYWIGLVVGETSFSILFRFSWIPVCASLLLPLLIGLWSLLVHDIVGLSAVVFFYGSCVGILNIWVVHRVVGEWLKKKSERDLRLYILALCVCMIPGVVLINTLMSAMEDFDGVIHHNSFLIPAFSLALISSGLVVWHKKEYK